MRSIIIIGSLFIFFIQHAISQPTQTIRGKVVDQESQMPLGGANIMILEAGPITGVITDQEGSFIIEEIPVGRYNLLFSYLGYKSFIMREVVVGTAKEVFLDVGMRELVYEMDEVSVAANISKDQTINPMAGVSARSFTVEETERYAGSWGDPARMASNYAGVFPNGDIYNYLVIRGNSPNGLIWRMEGIPIPNPNHFDYPGSRGGPISIVNNKLLSQSDFLTSAFPAEYSNGISGVFDLNLRNGNNNKREYVAEVGFMGLELGAEGPFSKKGRASYLINYRHSLLGLVDDLLWVEALPHYQDLNLKMNFPTKKGRISVFGFGGNSRILGIDDDQIASQPGYEHQITSETSAATGVIGLKHVHFFSDKTRIISDISVSSNLSSQQNDSLVNNVTSRELISNKYREDKFYISSRLLSKLNAKNSIGAGITIEDYFVDYSLQNEFDIFDGSAGDSLVIYPLTHLKRDHLIVLKSFFEWKYRFTNSLTLYSGVNYMHFFLNNSNSLEPRANLRWRIDDKQRLSLGYGLHSQMHPFYNYLLQKNLSDDKWDRENYEETNINLEFTKSHHFALGYDLAISEELRFKTEVFLQSLYNVPVEDSSSYYSLINLGAGSYNTAAHDLVNEGTGKNYGIEFTLEKFLSKGYYFLVTTSLLDSKYKGSDGVLRNTAFNSNYNVNVLVGYELPFRKNGAFDFNVRVVSSGGRRIIPHDVERTLEEEEDVYLYENAFEPRLAAYFRVDARAGYKYNGKRVRHEVAIDVTNLTNRQNEWERFYHRSTGMIEMNYQQGIFPFMYYRINF
jgi:hypothetical protein